MAVRRVVLILLILVISLLGVQCTIPPEVRIHEGILADLDTGASTVSFTFLDGKVITVTGNPPPELQLGKLYIITYYYTGALPGGLISIECMDCEEANATDAVGSESR